jgi:hypothetical protein
VGCNISNRSESSIVNRAPRECGTMPTQVSHLPLSDSFRSFLTFFRLSPGVTFFPNDFTSIITQPNKKRREPGEKCHARTMMHFFSTPFPPPKILPIEMLTSPQRAETMNGIRGVRRMHFVTSRSYRK